MGSLAKAVCDLHWRGPLVSCKAPEPDLSATFVSRILSLLKPVKVVSAAICLSLFNPKRPKGSSWFVMFGWTESALNTNRLIVLLLKVLAECLSPVR